MKLKKTIFELSFSGIMIDILEKYHKKHLFRRKFILYNAALTKENGIFPANIVYPVFYAELQLFILKFSIFK